MRAQIKIRLRKDILDPQGEALERAAGRLGYPNLKNLRVGKLIDVELEGSEEEVRASLNRIATDLLANPIMEDFEIDLK